MTEAEYQQRIADLEVAHTTLWEDNAKLREAVRQQGEFIQSMREMIRDFVYGQDASLGRLRRVRS